MKTIGFPVVPISSTLILTPLTAFFDTGGRCIVLSFLNFRFPVFLNLVIDDYKKDIYTILYYLMFLHIMTYYFVI